MIFKTDIIIDWAVTKTFTAMKSPAMMQKVAWPLVIFKPVKPKVFPDMWQDGETYKMNMYLLGFLPMGWQQLEISSEQDVNSNEYILKDIGPGWAVKWWDHKVTLKKVSDNSTHYEEQLVLKTGFLGPIIWLGMTVLFWWRKKRWLQITKINS